jgi:hypothetical protein
MSGVIATWAARGRGHAGSPERRPPNRRPPRAISATPPNRTPRPQNACPALEPDERCESGESVSSGQADGRGAREVVEVTNDTWFGRSWPRGQRNEVAVDQGIRNVYATKSKIAAK